MSFWTTNYGIICIFAICFGGLLILWLLCYYLGIYCKRRRDYKELKHKIKYNFPNIADENIIIYWNIFNILTLIVMLI